MNFKSTVRNAGAHRRGRFGIAAGMLMAALYAALVFGAAGDTTADRVLGQANFTSNGTGGGASGLAGPFTAAIDASVTPNRLYVADLNNNRVLGWRNAATFTNGQAADLVIGQPDFTSIACPNPPSAGSLCSPYAVAVDSSGNLYVADGDNNRVLEYSNPFTACGGVFPCVGGAANLVFGQGGSFTSNTANKGGVSADSLDGPVSVALDGSGNLYVGDNNNSRVLEYNTPLTTDTTADAVFGQGGSFTANTVNNGGVSADSLYFPFGVALDKSNNLYVADGGNNRVLEYNTPLTNQTADAVFGQLGSFTSNTQNKGGVSADSLSSPVGVALDGSGNLYVADTFNSRVLEYNTPLTTDTTADTVFGQLGSFTSKTANNGGLSADSLAYPDGVALDKSNNLYVVDLNNSRVLEYDQPLATPTPTATVTPTATQTATPTATTTATATATETATPTLTATTTATIAATPSTTATPTSTETSTATVSPSPTETPTPTATATETAVPTPTPTAVPGKLRIAPKRLNFGSVDVGTPKVKTVKITNAGKITKKKTAAPILIELETATPSAFAVAQTCAEALNPGAPHQPAGTCEVQVTFTPAAAVKYTGDLEIFDNVEPSLVKKWPPLMQTVPLTGTGKTPK